MQCPKNRSTWICWVIGNRLWAMSTRLSQRAIDRGFSTVLIFVQSITRRLRVHDLLITLSNVSCTLIEEVNLQKRTFFELSPCWNIVMLLASSRLFLVRTQRRNHPALFIFSRAVFCAAPWLTERLEKAIRLPTIQLFITLKLILCKITLRLLSRAEGLSIRSFSKGRMTQHLFSYFCSCLSLLSLNQQNNTEFAGFNPDCDNMQPSWNPWHKTSSPFQRLCLGYRGVILCISKSDKVIELPLYSPPHFQEYDIYLVGKLDLRLPWRIVNLNWISHRLTTA